MGKKLCYCCNKKINKIYLKTCNYCGQSFCISHIAPDIHQCKNKENFIDNKKDEYLENQKKIILEKNKVQKI